MHYLTKCSRQERTYPLTSGGVEEEEDSWSSPPVMEEASIPVVQLELRDRVLGENVPRAEDWKKIYVKFNFFMNYFSFLFMLLLVLN